MKRSDYQVAEIGAAVGRVIEETSMEIVRGQINYPDPALLVAALGEGFGDLSKAMLKGTKDEVVRRAVQVAAMAIRVAVEGDPKFDAHRQAAGLALVAPPFEELDRLYSARSENGGFPF